MKLGHAWMADDERLAGASAVPVYTPQLIYLNLNAAYNVMSGASSPRALWEMYQHQVIHSRI